MEDGKKVGGKVIIQLNFPFRNILIITTWCCINKITNNNKTFKFKDNTFFHYF